MKNMTMTKDKIEASKKKPGLDKSEKTKKLGLCQANACSKHATTTCKYCNMNYCDTHSGPKLSMSAEYIWSMDRSDYEKFNKYNKDWQAKDGHPDGKYTEIWNKTREEKKAQEYRDINNAYNNLFSSRKSNKNYQQDYSYQSNQGHTPYGNSSYGNSKWQQQNSSKLGKGRSARTYDTKTKSSVYSGKIILIIFAIVVVMGLSLHVSSFLKTNSSLGSKNYSILNRSLSNIGNISSEISTGILGPKINGTWATEFFSNVSYDRGSNYNYCPNLSNFAKVRFNTMIQNYGISHYGYNQDFESYYGTIYDTYFGEEVFYPSGTTPNQQIQDIMTNAPLHWKELSSSNYSYYGYYISNGPALDIINYCSITEIPGPNINISQFFASHGCTTEVTNETWFVIEISSSCPP